MHGGGRSGRYNAALRGLIPPAIRQGADHVFHLYVLRSEARDALQAALRGQDIGTGIHYPVPVHLQPAYVGRIALGHGGCPDTEIASRQVFSLPLYPELTDQQVETVCAALAAL